MLDGQDARWGNGEPLRDTRTEDDVDDALANALQDGVDAVGADVARGHWAVATTTPRGGLIVGRVDALHEVLVAAGGPLTIGVDIPVGLPAMGTRTADADARLVLAGRARARLFTTPVRTIVEDDRPAGDAGLQALSRALSGRGVSAQALALRARIREVDSLVRSSATARQAVHEVHPEVSLRILAGTDAPSKHTTEGVRFRLRVLRREFGAGVGRLIERSPTGVAADDVLDALLALWSAQRIAAGTALRFGGDHDDQGIPMTIHA